MPIGRTATDADAIALGEGTMKSPWKYLVELASLGRTAKQLDGQREFETSTAEVPPATLADDRSEASDPIGDAASAAADIPNEPEGTFEPGREEIRAVGLETSNVAVDLPSAKQRLPSKRPRRAPSVATRPQSPAQVDVVEYGMADPNAQPPLTLCAEIAALDDEIHQLRRQLSEKLRLQNKQLTKLLERFDAS